MYKKIKNIHLVGIGGIGLSSIAELLHRNGYTVSGSDQGSGENVRRLGTLGIQIHHGHRAENLGNAELLVYSSAINESNPELVEATRKGIPVIRRADMLAELMRLKHGIAIAGAHGKTTTTSMVAHILVRADFDPTIVVGGRMDNFGGTNARLGNSEFMVVEADESDGCFNSLSPSIAVVTNLDREHMEFYGSMPKLKAAFRDFMNKVPFYGVCIYCSDDSHLRVLSKRVSRRKISYGFDKDSDYQILNCQVTDKGTEAIVTHKNNRMTITLPAYGKHNMLNAVAALAVADELGVDRKISLHALGDFQGVQRRFQYRGVLRGVQFFDDYAHHPTEIKNTLQAARARFPKAKIYVLFQPHRYSRVNDLLEEFSRCFSDADKVAVTDIYSAGESPIQGLDAAFICKLITQNTQVPSEHSRIPEKTIRDWISKLSSGDVILTLGAGDLPNIYAKLF